MNDQVGSSERIGILVIHGMGEQAPYQTLDNFSRGLASALRRRTGNPNSYDIRFNPINRSDGGGEWTEARVELKPGVQAPSDSPSITIAEYYWSPKAEDKMPWKDTLKWLAVSDLSPIGHMAANVNEIWGDLTAAGTSEWKKTITAWRAITILTKEVTRALLIYIPLLLVVYWMLQWLGGGISEFFPQVAKYQDGVDHWLTPRHILLGSLGTVFLSVAYFLCTVIVPNAWRKIGTLWKQCLSGMRMWLRSHSQQRLVALAGESAEQSLRSQNDMVRFSRRIWMGTSCILLAVFAILIYWIYKGSVGGYWVAPILHWQLLIPLLPSAWQHWINEFLLWLSPYNNWISMACAAIAALAAIVMRNFLANYMGKVAIYVSTDANSANYAIRSAILHGSCDALNSLLDPKGTEPQYNRVYIAAHSLGTAIALDTINELFIRAEADAALGTNLQRLRGLLTFGSPLNKIWYFFRQQTEADEALRAQILSKLHAFRRVSSRRDYDPYNLLPQTTLSTGPENPLPTNPEFLWVNVIARMDVFTGPLRYNSDPSTDTYGSLTLKPSNEGFYWVDRQYKGSLRRYWKPVLAHNTYWDDPCLYERFLADFKI